MNHTTKFYMFFIFSLFIVFSSCKDNKKEELPNTIKEKTIKTEKPSLELVWKTDTIFKTPESVLFDQTRNVIYISNVNLNPRKKDKNGFISKLNKDGSIIDLHWVENMSSPKGMGLYGSTLYVTDVDEIIAIDVDTGSILKKYSVDNAGMLNDISIDVDGTVFITDMDTGKILTLKDEEVTLWKSKITTPNGIFVENDRLLVASKNGNFTAYNKASKEASIICNSIGKGDGVELMKSGNYLVSDWSGELFLIQNNKPISILSTKENNIQTADIGIIKEENIVLIPTFFDNKVMAYKVNE